MPMKLLTGAITRSIAAATTAPEAPPHATEAPSNASSARRPRPRSRLPRDATVHFNNYPTELYVNMTITRIEHIDALMETLHTYAHHFSVATTTTIGDP